MKAYPIIIILLFKSPSNVFVLIEEWHDLLLVSREYRIVLTTVQRTKKTYRANQVIKNVIKKIQWPISDVNFT